MSRAEQYAEQKGHMFFPTPYSAPTWPQRPEFFCDSQIPMIGRGRFRIAWVDSRARLALPSRRLKRDEALALARWITEVFT